MDSPLLTKKEELPDIRNYCTSPNEMMKKGERERGRESY